MVSSNSIWTRQFAISQQQSGQRLPGDKIILPPSALEQLISAYARTSDFVDEDTYHRDDYLGRQRTTELPQPLTFRLVNSQNGRAVYAGIREFSSSEDEVILSPALVESLGLNIQGESDAGLLTIHARQLPKGTYVKLRPLEAGYDPADWKSLLEQHLRANYTTLTKGEVLTVRAGQSSNDEYKFLADEFKPDVDGICVVDTDLEVDIEALNEEQARETLRRIAEKKHRTGDGVSGSSSGGAIDIFTPQTNQVIPGEYVDYTLSSWDRTQPLDIELGAEDGDESLSLLVSPFTATQRSKPREDDHVFAAFDSRPTKRLRLEATNAALTDAEALYISVQAYSQADDPKLASKQYTIRANHVAIPQQQPEVDHAAEVECKNCGQWVSKQSLVLHENFCYRNNILCPQGCGQVFQKRSPTYADHWHCPYDNEFGNAPIALEKHNHLYHPADVLRCPDCGTKETFSNIPALAQHRTTTCPAKIILCRFCHLEVPQEGDPDMPSAEVLLSGMTQHELSDGARTTECHLCGKIVRLRDMDLHLKSHDLDRHSRPAPRPCRNVCCGRTMDTTTKDGDTRAGTRMAQGPGNDIGLCNICFGPLYVSLHDPDGKALRRRVERRYLQQLVTASCGKAWCRNEYCKTGRSHIEGLDGPIAFSMKDALPMVKPFVDVSTNPAAGSPLHFCVDERSQRFRTLAGMLDAEPTNSGQQGYTFVWILGAVEAEGGDLDAARQWLKNFAPTRSGT